MVLFAIGVASDETSCGNTGTFVCYYNNYVLDIITDSNLGTTCPSSTCQIIHFSCDLGSCSQLQTFVPN